MKRKWFFGLFMMNFFILSSFFVFLNYPLQSYDIITHNSNKPINYSSVNVTHPSDLVLNVTDPLDNKSGLVIYRKNLGDLQLNPDLVGGFLHALQSFGVQFSATETKMKTLTYENYQFQIETGKFIRVALIVRATPNQFLISKLAEFVKEFERIFGEYIVNYTGNAELFKVASELFENIFR